MNKLFFLVSFLIWRDATSWPTLFVTSADGPEGFTILQAALDNEFAKSISIIAGVSDLNSTNAKTLSAKGIALRHLDSARVVNESVFSGVNSVFILPPLTDDRVERTARIIAGASEAGVKQALLLSVIGAGSGLPSLAGYKNCEDQVKHAWPNSSVLLRTAFYMQNLLLWGPRVAAQGILTLPLQGNSRIAPLYEADVAAVVMAMTHGSEGRLVHGTFNLTGPELLTGEMLAWRLSETLGRLVSFLPVPIDNVTDMLSKDAPALSASERRLVADLSSINVDTTSYIFERITHKSPTPVTIFFSQERKAFLPTTVV